MRVDHTAISRAATATAALLGLVELLRFVLGDHDSYVGALLLTLVLAMGAAVAKLYRDNCLESRITAALLAGLSGTGVALASTVGLPGQTAQPLSVLGVLTLILSTGVLALLAIDQPRRASRYRSGSPYAS